MQDIRKIFISEDNYSQIMDRDVVPFLDSRKEIGYLETKPGTEIYYENFYAESPIADLLVIHGFTEAIPKYYELIYYFLKSGFNVYFPEMRGHGRSTREVEDKLLTHVDKFEDYYGDIEKFADRFLCSGNGLPKLLYCHSMGGAVGIWLMEEHPALFKKAILSSPMVAPQRKGFPLWMSKAICGSFCRAGKGKTMFFNSAKYSLKRGFEHAKCTSRARYEYYEKRRRENDIFSNAAPTYRWVYESLIQTARILKKDRAAAIETEIYLLQADKESMVIPRSQFRLAKELKKCTVEKIPGTEHEIFRSSDDVLEKTMEKMINFFVK